MRELIDRVLARLGIYETEYLAEGMAQVGPKTTGYPIWIQIRQKPDGKHKEPSIKVRLFDGKFKQKEGTSVVSLRTAKVIKGEPLTPSDSQHVASLIKRARTELFMYWEGDIQDTQEVLDALKPK